MKKITLPLLVACLIAPLAGTSSAQNEIDDDLPGSECMHTNRTPIIPDGNIASKDELVSAKTRIKAYQDNLLDFRECLVKAEKALDPDAEGFTATIEEFGKRSDASIDLETKVAEEFNQAIKIYKSR